MEVMARRMAGDKSIDEAMFQAAVALAPYVHPRLSQTDTTVRSDNIHRVVSEEPLTIEEWCARNNVSRASNDITLPTIEGCTAAD
jgi:hypothetical protein